MKRLVIISGASSGIGAATAWACSRPQNACVREMVICPTKQEP